MPTGKTAATAKRVASKNWGSSVPVMEYGYAARIVGFNVNKQGQPHLIVDISGIEYFNGRVQAINIAKREKAIVPFEAQHWAKGNTWPLFARLVRGSVLTFDIMIAQRGDMVLEGDVPVEGEHGELLRYGLVWNPDMDDYEEKDVADIQYRIRNEQIMLSEKADVMLDRHDDTVNAANAKARGGSTIAAPAAPSKEEMDDLFGE